MKLEKLVYLLWSPRGRSRARTRELLLETCAPRLLESGLVQLSICVADPEVARVRSPAPRLYLEPPICAELGVWVEDLAARPAIEGCLAGAGFRLAGYHVEETLYTDYGENRHAPPRSWPDGQRSPGVVAVTLLARPSRLPHEEWLRRWQGRMSPVSEAIQPRTRYLRNLVLRPLTDGAPAWAGIVEEAWPSRRHVENPFLFYGARGPLELARNLFAILGAVRSFLQLTRVRTTMMSEYLVRTDPRVPRVRRGPYDL
jgi:hypothetical protein